VTGNGFDDYCGVQAKGSTGRNTRRTLGQADHRRSAGDVPAAGSAAAGSPKTLR